MTITVNEAIEDIKSMKATGMESLNMAIEALEVLKKIDSIMMRETKPSEAIIQIVNVMPDFDFED